MINIADPTNATHSSNQRCVDPKTNNVLRVDGSRSMTGNLNMNISITNIKEAPPHESAHAAVDFVNKTVSNNNAIIMNYYEKYVDDRLNHFVSGKDQKNAFQYLMGNSPSEFSDEDDVTGVQITNNDFHKVQKETYESKLHLDSAKVITAVV